ncbi:TIGR03985 family CRISPR-associated protein [Phormidium sp. LEGE 05292]|uniref:TIGR03985 family CRISPR-associated protein n=1 Tax=[Phormidium] sp. LEGE 05292 TaxID=767427 RepID=UPI00187E83BD|nr:TIGR03985 family CRISPR-associated protein [Phormidium sp. LEGE 05292]MBE9227487.1 TIGR03985 family CRISPR-associated protein [Phormidium sp. LEGE 05292]
MNLTFRNPPYPKLLQHLAKGSLDQSQNLTRALRLWTLLRWLYSDQGYDALSDCFTYASWRENFFSECHKDEKQENILNCHNPNCACHKTANEWLITLEVPLTEWQKSLQKEIPLITSQNLEKLLQEPLFAQVRKSLQSDFELLINRNWLQDVTNSVGRSKKYRRVTTLPIRSESEESVLNINLTPQKQAYVAETLDMLDFLDPNFPLLAEQISEEISTNSRVFLYQDYIIPDASLKQDIVEQIQSELQEIWETGKILPLLLTYHSAHQNKMKECIVYPVCIYFMERAKYLCGYGKNPKDEIDWYNYRLDRIVSKRLVCLDWLDTRIPQLLKEKYEDDQLPTKEAIKSALEAAWGYDFYKKKSLLILRFERDFHDSYIQGISLHKTFTSIDYEQTVKLIKQYTLNLEHQQALLDILQSRPNTDAYYKAFYRVKDYHVIRRLRALGSKVEVMLPWDLRKEMASETHKAWNLYKC